MSQAALRVILVAGHPVVRAGLHALLHQHGNLQVIGESATADEAVELCRREAADVVILDPDSDEVSLGAVALVAESAEARVLVFTATTDPATLGQAIELGAAGVVSKDQSGDVLARAIQKVHDGELWLDRARTALVLSHAIRRGRDPETAKIQSLTRREREIVSLVAEGLRNAAIAERLFISEATVRNHLTSILGKLSLADRFDLAVYAFRHGLTSAAPSAPAREARMLEGRGLPRERAADRRGWAGRAGRE